MHDDTTALRQWFAEGLRLATPIRRNLAIVDAFAAVPRERFLGPGPWQIMSDKHPDDPFTTPDDQPHWLYHDVLVAIDPARRLNNGMPSFWAHNLDHLDLRRGERVLQVGAGTGYYSAVLAQIVGREGHVAAVEHDPGLAARAADNLAPWDNVDVVAGDGRAHDPGDVDVVVVFAGSTHPAPLWLDRLADGGRLLMPLTGDDGIGFMLRATRHDTAFDAAAISGVGIFHCVAGRDTAAASRLQQALTPRRAPAVPWQRQPIPIQALHRGDPAPQDTDRVWYHAPGFWLERQPAQGIS
ncbi:protein-L-isoaspartate O-methyltransferase family protein [Vineibacter terrae]|uniref:protein-L-isoaspartate O-methyltransferase family protein n=1 Tax=Vineibacter terrae TaxID=2586908 RepID=UPI002E346EA5|nr:methyltransferase domain-containing protein [Vineibacter terrae]HEX2889906.1 methyltransferase domain-containing protein [Vineibacter terrae]